MSVEFRKKMWLWGQNVGGHHAAPQFRLPGVNRMDSAECCREWGIPNCCRVRLGAGPVPPFDAETEKLKDLDEIVWSAVGSVAVRDHNGNCSDLDEVLRQAERFENVTGAVLDDFFTPPEQPPRHTLESIRSIRDRLHHFPKRPLDLWLVWYEHQLSYPVEEYLELCDVITFWTWQGENLKDLKKNLDSVCRRTPGKRHMAGIYLWDYGKGKPLTLRQMEDQCELCREMLAEGSLDGMIFCSNCIADIGLETADWTRKWIAEHIAEEDVR